MAWRPDGFDSYEIDRGFRTVAGDADLRLAVDEHPVLSSPFLHSQLRGHAQDLKSEGCEDEHFAARCDELVKILHERHYREAALAGGHTTALSSHCDSTTPPYFSSIIELLGRAVPSEQRAPLDPANDGAAISAQLSSLSTASHVVLPAYEPSPAGRWLIVVLNCSRCGCDYAAARAHYRELSTLPGQEADVAARATSLAVCPYCRTATGLACFVWICEGPPPSDPLNALSTLVRVNGGELGTWCPPPSGERDPRMDRVVEMRFDRFMRDTGLTEHPASEGDLGRLRLTSFAYGAQDLVSLLKQVAERSRLPLDLQLLVQDLAQRVRSGLASPSMAVDYLKRIEASIPDDWPVLLDPTLPMNDPHMALAAALIADVCGRRSSAPLEIRAAAASEIVRAHLVLRNDALAAAALDRAEELAGALRPGDAREHRIATNLNCRAELHFRAGEYRAATESLRALRARQEALATTVEMRLAVHQGGAYMALAQFRAGMCDEAFETFRIEVAALEEFCDQRARAVGQGEDIVLRAAKHSLGQALANWASLLLDLSDYIQRTPAERFADLLRRLSRREQGAIVTALEGATSLDEALQGLENALPSGALDGLDAVGRCAPLYSAFFRPDALAADGPTADDVRSDARELLGRALRLSDECGSWNHAGRQAMRLAELAAREKNLSEYTKWASRALAYAKRAPTDDDTMCRASVILAHERLVAQDGVGTLDHVRGAARAFMRAIVLAGHREHSAHMCDELMLLAMDAAVQNAPHHECIVVAESVRSVTLGVSLTVGLGFVENELQPTAASRLKPLREAREKLLMLVETDSNRRDVHQRNLRRIEQSIEHAQRELYGRDPRYARWCDATALDVSDAQAFVRRLVQRGSGLTYVGYVPCRQRIYAYAIWDGGSVVQPTDWPRGEPVPPRSSPGEPDLIFDDGLEGAEVHVDTQKLDAWSVALLGPLRSRLRELGPDDTVVFSVRPPFDRIPFAALLLDGVRLCERVQVAYVDGIAAYEACERRPAIDAASVLCLGDPDRNDVEPLLYSDTEVRRVAEGFAGSGRDARVALGADATFGVLAEDAAKYRVVHVACHADTSLPGDPRPHLLLAQGSGDDGVVTAERIVRELRLAPGTLVNISACRSALHEESTGYTAGGLAPAFLIVGASAVLGSLWPIADDAALVFAEAFYERLRTGIGPTASLAQVQRACIAGERGHAMTAPEAWAAYVLYGSGR